MPRCLSSLRALICAGLLATLVAPAGRADVLPPESFSGYTLNYAITWNGIPAAHAEARLQSDAKSPTGPAHRLDVRGWTLPLLGLIWPARNQVEAAVGHDLSSRYFRIHRQERRKEQSTEITFNPDMREVHIVRHKTSGRVKTSTRPLEDLREPLALIYALRMQSTDLGTEWSGKVVVSDDVYRVTVRVVDRGTLKVAGKRRPVVCVVPEAVKLEDDGTEEPLRKVDSVRVWVTDDPLRIPVRLSASAFIGRVTMGLRDTEPPLITLYDALEHPAPVVAENASAFGDAAGE